MNNENELTAALANIEKLRLERDQMAAENVALKDCVANHAPAVDHWNAWADQEDKIKHAPETPATDRIVAGIKADGVEQFASYISLYNSNAERHAIDFAKKLRDGANHD